MAPLLGAGRPPSAAGALQLNLPVLAPVRSLHQLMSVSGLIIIKDKKLRSYACVDTSVLILMVCLLFNGLFVLLMASVSFEPCKVGIGLGRNIIRVPPASATADFLLLPVKVAVIA